MTTYGDKENALKSAIDITKAFAGSGNPRSDLHNILDDLYKKLVVLYVDSAKSD
jgi:hypothetical protein